MNVRRAICQKHRSWGLGIWEMKCRRVLCSIARKQQWCAFYSVRKHLCRSHYSGQGSSRDAACRLAAVYNDAPHSSSRSSKRCFRVGYRSALTRASSGQYSSSALRNFIVRWTRSPPAPMARAAEIGLEYKTYADAPTIGSVGHRNRRSDMKCVLALHSSELRSTS